MKLRSRFNCFNKGGRNNQGRITKFHRGGGNKKLYRLIDFKRSLFNEPGKIKSFEYDPYRTAKIALVNYKSGILSYILAPEGSKVGDIILSGPSAEISIGHALPIDRIPIGSMIHNIELKPGKGGQLVRAAGTFAKLIKKKNGYGIIRFQKKRGGSNSGSTIQRKLYSIPLKSMATLGSLYSDFVKDSTITFFNENNSLLDQESEKSLLTRNGTTKNSLPFKKAGSSRWKGKRPTVRGVAMNPVDHPHGGGEGKSKGGRHPVTPWGKLTKGVKTRRTKLNRSKKNGLDLSHT